MQKIFTHTHMCTLLEVRGAELAFLMELAELRSGAPDAFTQRQREGCLEKGKGSEGEEGGQMLACMEVPQTLAKQEFSTRLP